ncbi:aspartyl/asparaginyl beta-hydroxylase domain-containing protein [Flavisolibacter sp. BT320]|nr:aspartyl/asparaginyl beta-hydroxylase domain-containing protein [Flavisolibacter longurius]
MLKYAQLPQQFDAEKMKAEVASLEAAHWKQHYNKAHYEGGWTVLPLRSINGETENIFAVHAEVASAGQYQDTVLLQACPYIQSVLQAFPCEKTAVRLMKLQAGAVIKEHRDTALRFEDGEARLHIPVVTNPAVSFYLDDEKLQLKEGECWYMNLCLRHRVQNKGTTDRVHLVVDCLVNDWLREVLTTGAVLQKNAEEESTNAYDAASKQKMVNELRRMNTPVSLALAAQLEDEIS